MVLPALDRSAASLRTLSRDGVDVVVGPVPVKVHSETPSSSCFGDCLARAMLDFGLFAYANFDTDRDNDLEKAVVVSCLCMDCPPLGGVQGGEFFVVLVVLALGEGVSGSLPPAVLVENRP